MGKGPSSSCGPLLSVHHPRPTARMWPTYNVHSTLYYYHDSTRPTRGLQPLRVPDCTQNGGEFGILSIGVTGLRVISVSSAAYINDNKIIIIILLSFSKLVDCYRCSNSRYSYNIYYDVHETATNTTMMIIITLIITTCVVMINSTGRPTSSTRRRWRRFITITNDILILYRQQRFYDYCVLLIITML